MYVCLSLSLYIYIYIYTCVCVCVYKMNKSYKQKGILFSYNFTKTFKIYPESNYKIEEKYLVYLLEYTLKQNQYIRKSNSMFYFR